MHTPLLLDFLNGLMWWQGWMRATEPTPPFIAEQDNTATAQYSVFERIKSKLSKPPVAGDYVHYGWMMPINNSFSRLLIDIDHPNADFKNDLITATKDLIEGNYEDDARKLYMDTIFYYDQQIGEPVLILVSRNEKTLTLPPKDDDAEKDHLKDAKREEKWQLEPLPVPSH